MALRFEMLAKASACHARLGRVHTAHGSFDTPAFMPVATAGAMKGLTPSQVSGTGSQIILNNAFHLMLRPGAARVRSLGGCHEFMRWSGPILTDSGGYQAFSMSDIVKLDETGVEFRSFVDGAKVHMSPESSMQVQQDLGSDIAMAFDDCAPLGAPQPSRDRIREAHERTLRWLERCVKAHRSDTAQSLFGIVQGGSDLDLRRASVQGVCAHDLPGYAIGGVAVGESTQAIREVVAFTAPLLPADRPRYLMGVGYEWDIVDAVASGIDMFDCVLPTRNGRNGTCFTTIGPVRLKNAVHAQESAPIDSSCDCECCAGGFSRAYLRHLFMAGEMLGPILASLHNIRHFQRLLLDIRSAIREDTWLGLETRWPCLAAGRIGARHQQEPDS
ncbi:MAG: tRNA guanosine(34) transglycosylase Tgt [Phycisphaerales bacterium]|nr:tRNA guanosine(34) transglycosylase Tgt [Phycisphaerales bacterium]